MEDWSNPRIIIFADPASPQLGLPPQPAWWKQAGSWLALILIAGSRAARAALLTGLPLLTIGALIWLIVTDIGSHRVEIAPIGVPRSLEESGITMDVAARRLLDSIETIQRNADTTMRGADTSLAGESIDFSVPGVGLSLSAIVRAVRRILGIPSPRVTGEIVQEGTAFVIRLRVEGREPATATSLGGPEAIDELFNKAARELLLRTTPFLVVAYDFRQGRDSLELLELARRVEVSGIGPSETLWRVINLQGRIHHERLRDTNVAMMEFERALSIDPRASAVHLNIGNVFDDLNRQDLAEARYRDALRLDPEFALAYYNLGRILRRGNRLDEAEANYRKALNLNSRFVDAMVALGNLLNIRGSHEEAQIYLRNAVRIDPVSPFAHLGLANLYFSMQRFSLAEEHCRTAVGLRANMADAHFNLAIVLQAQGRIGLSLVSAWHALSLSRATHVIALVQELEGSWVE